MGKCAFIAPKIRKFLSLLHVCCIKEIAEEEWMNESVATITSSSTTTIKTLYMLHVTPFMLHLFRSSVSQSVVRSTESKIQWMKKLRRYTIRWIHPIRLRYNSSERKKKRSRKKEDWESSKREDMYVLLCKNRIPVLIK